MRALVFSSRQNYFHPIGCFVSNTCTWLVALLLNNADRLVISTNLPSFCRRLFNIDDVQLYDYCMKLICILTLIYILKRFNTAKTILMSVLKSILRLTLHERRNQACEKFFNQILEDSNHKLSNLISKVNLTSCLI